MKQAINIIGGGAAALSLASFLDSAKFRISIYEKNKSLGRKFLVAGKGGFNLTFNEPTEKLVSRFTPTTFLKPALEHFDNIHFRAWLKTLGIPTFVGSSNRVFPEKGIKPIEVLNKILSCLRANEVEINYESSFTGWNKQSKLCINDQALKGEAINIFALGGASWQVTGSDGSWLKYFGDRALSTLPFQASNCACHIDWPQPISQNHAGQSLKNISLSCQDMHKSGELVITALGLEGNAIYALAPQIRAQINRNQTAQLYLDLKPSLTKEIVLKKIKESKFKNLTAILKKDLRFSKGQMGLIKNLIKKEHFLDPEVLSSFIKVLPINVNAMGPIDKAISTVGGIPIRALDNHFQLKNLENNYCIGEMVDWDAPTGGYLLQACFSMGAFLAKQLNAKY